MKNKCIQHCSLGIQFATMNKRLIHSVIVVLCVSMLTNAFGWAFNGEVFAHELDHEHHVLSLDPTAHLEAHHQAVLSDDDHLDAATHLCLHAAGQYQPFFLNTLPLVPVSIGSGTLAAFVSVSIPESIPDSLFHPPRSVFTS